MTTTHIRSYWLMFHKKANHIMHCQTIWTHQIITKDVKNTTTWPWRHKSLLNALSLSNTPSLMFLRITQIFEFDCLYFFFFQNKTPSISYKNLQLRIWYIQIPEGTRSFHLMWRPTDSRKGEDDHWLLVLQLILHQPLFSHKAIFNFPSI